MTFNKNTPVSGDIILSAHIRNIEDYIENLITVNDGTSDITGVIKLIFNGFNISGDATSGISISPSATDNVTTSGDITGDNITATTNINAVDIIASGDISSTNLTVTNDINTDNVIASGDISSDNITTTGDLVVGGSTTLNTIINNQSDATNGYVIADTDNRLLIDTGAPVTFAMPLASAWTGRKIAIIDKTGQANTNNVTINRTSPDLINDAVVYVIDQDFGYVELESDGTKWLVVNESHSEVVPTGTSGISFVDGLSTSLYDGLTFNKKIINETGSIVGFYAEVDECPVGESADVEFFINGASLGTGTFSSFNKRVLLSNPITLNFGDKITYTISNTTNPNIGNDVYFGVYDFSQNILQSSILFSRNDQIFSINPDGTGEQAITSDGNSYYFANYNSDGTKIVMNEDNSHPDTQTWKMDSDGSNITQVTFEVVGGDYDSHRQPSYSRTNPDLLVYQHTTNTPSTNTEIRIMNDDDTGDILVINASGNQESLPKFNNDDTKIVFTNLTNLYTCDIDGSNLTTVANAGNCAWGNWNHNGTKIVYQTDDGGMNSIWIMDADGTNKVKLTNNPTNIQADQQPDFSPDGTQICFARNISGTQQLMVMDIDGSNVLQLTSAGVNSYYASWGERLV